MLRDSSLQSAVAMMARMMLHGRIYQYGFYQAAMAAVVIPAILIGESAAQASAARKRHGYSLDRDFRVDYSRHRHAGEPVSQTFATENACGRRRDRSLLCFPGQIEPTGKLVSVISKGLRKAAGRRTLLVLPEGVMINYLARAPSSIASFFYFSTTMEQGGEERIVADLERHPPDWS